MILTRNSFKQISSALALAVFLLSSISQANAKDRESANCWSIDYTTNFAGPLRIRFSDKALGMQLEKFGLKIFASGPEWNSLVYNDLNQRYMKVTREHWRTSQFIEHLLKKRKTSDGSSQTEYTKNLKTINGLKASQVIVKTKKVDGSFEEASEMWVTNEVSVPTQFKEFLRMALGVSENCKGTPLQIFVMQRDLADKKPHMVQALAAYNVSRISEKADTFRTPAGYREVKTEMNLMIDEDTEPVEK